MLLTDRQPARDGSTGPNVPAISCHTRLNWDARDGCLPLAAIFIFAVLRSGASVGLTGPGRAQRRPRGLRPRARGRSGSEHVVFAGETPRIAASAAARGWLRCDSYSRARARDETPAAALPRCRAERRPTRLRARRPTGESGQPYARLRVDQALRRHSPGSEVRRKTLNNTIGENVSDPLHELRLSERVLDTPAPGTRARAAPPRTPDGHARHPPRVIGSSKQIASYLSRLWAAGRPSSALPMLQSYK